MISEFTTM
jgi:hypothetical protein